MSRVLSTAVRFLAVPLIALCSITVSAQSAPREIRIEVRDRAGHPIPGARVDFPQTGDTATTDSSGKASAEVQADSSITIVISRDGFDSRALQFTIGRAPAFLVNAVLGATGQRVPTVKMVPEYPGEPWRVGYEERRRRSSGSFRDRSYFTGTQPQLLDDWFTGMPGVQAGSQGLVINRCRRMGVWIDGMHATNPNVSAGFAMQQLAPNDIAAVEVYRLAQQQTQFSAPDREDCTLVIWTRSR